MEPVVTSFPDTRPPQSGGEVVLRRLVFVIAVLTIAKTAPHDTDHFDSARSRTCGKDRTHCYRGIAPRLASTNDPFTPEYHSRNGAALFPVFAGLPMAGNALQAISRQQHGTNDGKASAAAAMNENRVYPLVVGDERACCSWSRLW